MGKMEIDNWLLQSEPNLYKKINGSDPYSIWVTRLNGLVVEKTPARLLAYADVGYTKAHVIYLDGTRGIVFKEQMTPRKETKNDE